MRRFWNGIFSFSEDNHLAKIDYNKVEARLQIHAYEYRLTELPWKEGKEEHKNNP